jgi:hypothetical protein
VEQVPADSSKRGAAVGFDRPRQGLDGSGPKPARRGALRLDAALSDRTGRFQGLRGLDQALVNRIKEPITRPAGNPVLGFSDPKHAEPLAKLTPHLPAAG